MLSAARPGVRQHHASTRTGPKPRCITFNTQVNYRRFVGAAALSLSPDALVQWVQAQEAALLLARPATTTSACQDLYEASVSSAPTLTDAEVEGTARVVPRFAKRAPAKAVSLDCLEGGRKSDLTERKIDVSKVCVS